MAKPSSPLTVALVGGGRVGTAVSILLQAAGHRIVGVSSRTQESAQAAAKRLGTSVLHERGPIDASLVLLAVPDGAIATVAAQFAARLNPESVACHFAGSLGAEVLTRAGIARAVALHPVQACPDVDSAIARLPGSAWGVTVSPGSGLEEWATGLVEHDLRGLPVVVAEGDRALWHAAAATTANGVTALLAAGEAMLAAIGIERPVEVLGPLAAGTIANARGAGNATAVLTGPAIRGDRATLQRHIDALAKAAPDLIEAYGLAARITLDAVRRSGRLDERAHQELDAALELE